MKKLIKIDFNNTTRERKTEDSYSELYSYDKNNGSFEFEILNDTLTTEQVIALFKFTESNKVWKTTGTVEGNKVKVTFDTSLITQNETVICYLYFDEEQRTSDTFRFKFKVKVSEIDKISRYEVKERFINNTVIVDRLDVVTKDELKEALKKEDKDTKYDDTEVKHRLTELENKPVVDTSVFVTDEKLASKGYLTQHQSLENVVTKEELEAKHYVTEEALNNKGYLTSHQDLSSYALKSEIPTPYNDSPLTERVTALENRPPTGGSVDTSNLATKEELAKAVTKEELEAKNYVTTDELNNKGYLTTHQPLDNLVTKEELNSKGYVTDEVLNSKGYLTEEVLNSKNYLTEDVLNTKNYLTQHQDLSSLVTKQELENKHFLAEHQPLTHLATTSDLEALRNIAVSKSELSKKLDTTEYNSFKDSVVTKSELAEKGYISDLSNYVTKQELPQPYNDSALVSRVSALESKPTTNQYEIHGTGMPNGVVEAEIGTTYVDKNKTNGALKWIKTTDGGNTGWEVLIGDTGWRTLNSVSRAGNSFIKIRRVNNLVTYQFGGLQWGWFGVGKRNGPGFVRHNSSGDKGAKLTYPNGIPEGFRSENSLVGPTYDDKGKPYGIWYLGGKSDLNFIQFTFNDPIPTDKDIGDIRVSAISYLTEEPWPTTLP